MEAITREEQLMAAAAGQAVELPEPITRREKFLKAIADAVQSGGASAEVIQAAVNKYLEENPVEAGSQVYVQAEEPTDAPVGSLWFDTDAEAEIPTVLPNPHALTLTGAVEATYDGSKAVSVEIPSGGGASYSGFELIVDHTITADEATATSITFTKEAHPLINSQKLLIVEIQKPASVATPLFTVKAGTVEAVNPKEGSWSYYRMVADASNGIWTQAFNSGTNINSSDNIAPGYILAGTASTGNKNKAFADYTSISLTSYKEFLEENTTVKIWGGKA